VKEIYTLDGNVLRQDGVVSTYGSVDLIKNKYKYLNGAKSRNQVTSEINSLQKEKTQIEEDIKVLKEKVNDEKVARHNMEVAKLEARREEIGVSINLIKKGGQGRKEVKIPKGLEG
jgi:chromosome segregation ATPase